MGALGLALFSALSWGTADFFGGLTTRRFGILLVGVISQGAGLVLTGAFIVIGGSPMPDERGILFGVAAGVCATVGLGALYQGLAVGPMSVVAPITALEVVVPVTVGFVRGDRPSSVQIAGILIGVVGVVLASRETAADADATVPRVRGVVYGIVAAVFLGLLVTFLNEAGKESAPWAVFTLRLVSVPVFLIALLVTRAWRGRHPTPRDTAIRGSQVSFRHPEGYAMMQALIHDGVIGDFRAPDILRFGFTPLYLRYVDVWDAVTRLRRILVNKIWDQPAFKQHQKVT